MQVNRAKCEEGNEVNDENPWICPFKIWERNVTFPPLADALDITYDDRVGRHVKATRDIKAGKLMNYLPSQNTEYYIQFVPII